MVADDAVVRRTADGWRVGDDELPDLTCAMVLADLLAAELPTDIQPLSGRAGLTRLRTAGRPGSAAGSTAPAPRAPPTMEEEAHRLRTTVGQLEHALTARIRVEQAIGVLAERHRIRPRQAFEQLRSAARNRGRRVIDIAADVVASATNPLLQLPEELSRQRSGPGTAAGTPAAPWAPSNRGRACSPGRARRRSAASAGFSFFLASGAVLVAAAPGLAHRSVDELFTDQLLGRPMVRIVEIYPEQADSSSAIPEQAVPSRRCWMSFGSVVSRTEVPLSASEIRRRLR